MVSGSTEQMPRERAVEVVVSQKLGGRFISAVPMGGSGSGAGVYRVRAQLGGESNRERELVVKLDKVRGAPVTDDLYPLRIYAARSWNLQPAHALLRAHGLHVRALGLRVSLSGAALLLGGDVRAGGAGARRVARPHQR